MTNNKIYLVQESFNDNGVIRAFSTNELLQKCSDRIWRNFWENYADKIPDCNKDELIEENPQTGDFLVRTPEGKTVYRLWLRVIELDNDVKHDFTL